MNNEFYPGIDLGQSQDYTAIVVLEKIFPPPIETIEGNRYRMVESTEPARYECRHIERLPLGTRYPAIVEYTRQMLMKAPLNQNTFLTIDATGVGRPVCDMFAAAGIKHEGVTITGGDSESHVDGLYRVPKRQLVSRLQVVLQEERLKIGASLPFAATLAEEMNNFKVKITVSANDTYGAWREGDHDDLVLALAMAVWRGERGGSMRWSEDALQVLASL